MPQSRPTYTRPHVSASGVSTVLLAASTYLRVSFVFDQRLAEASAKCSDMSKEGTFQNIRVYCAPYLTSNRDLG